MGKGIIKRVNGKFHDQGWSWNEYSTRKGARDTELRVTLGGVTLGGVTLGARDTGARDTEMSGVAVYSVENHGKIV